MSDALRVLAVLALAAGKAGGELVAARAREPERPLLGPPEQVDELVVPPADPDDLSDRDDRHQDASRTKPTSST